MSQISVKDRYQGITIYADLVGKHHINDLSIKLIIEPILSFSKQENVLVLMKHRDPFYRICYF